MKIGKNFSKIFGVLTGFKNEKIVALIVVLVVVSSLLLSQRVQKSELPTVKVRNQDIKSTVSAAGILTGKEVANLKFKTSGKLAYLGVRTGDEVNTWQSVASLDIEELDISLQQALNIYRDKQAAVEKILDEVKNHDADETFEQKQKRTSAEVARDNAYDGVKQAQFAIDNSVLYSPISGIVTSQSDLVVGQNISSADLVAQVVDFSQKIFLAEVDEADISKINPGQKTEASLNAYPDKIYTGSVSEILPQTKTTSNGATIVLVKIILDEVELKPIYGLNGQVNIITAEKSNALSVPQEAVSDNNEVYLKKDGRFVLTKVNAGLKSDENVEILSGVMENDEIVKHNQFLDKAQKPSLFSRFFRRI